VTISSTGSGAAIVSGDTGDELSYDELRSRVDARAADFARQTSGSLTNDVVFLQAESTIDAVVDYLALRAAEVPVVMLDPAMAEADLDRLIASYRPAAVLRASRPIDGYSSATTQDAERFELRRDNDEAPVSWAERAAVLLPTSGSTGNPKLVQLTAQNLDVNAADIATVLGITGDDRGLAPLPLFYSYGLSILNSHLAAGATAVLSTASPLRPEFWDVVSGQQVTSIPGVPYSYEMFRRAGLLDRNLTSVRYMTQAGGKLPKDQVVEFHAGLAAKDCKLFVMYGQTEAAPRMSTLPSDDLPSSAGSVGFALPSGRFDIVDADDSGTGEVVYEGPNVMIGYVNSRADLGVRTQHGGLRTGDLGHLDDDGRLFITGRLKRMAKLFGTRVNLDDIEATFAAAAPVAAVEGKNSITVFIEGADDEGVDANKTEAKQLERKLRVPPRTIRVSSIEQLPLTGNGKIDYRRLTDDA
jgi:acyl-CoA synthetase (AMP-forming)/AMP-acid ligase II